MTKVINLRKKYKRNFKPINKPSIKKQNNISINIEFIKAVFTILSVISILTGCLIFRYNPNAEVSDLANKFLSVILNESFLEIFITLLKNDLLYYLLIFFIGTSVIGVPLTFIPLLLKSIVIGYFGSYMYCEYELKGVLFCLILIYPFFVITTTSLIYASNESVYMCRYIFNTLTNKNTADNISIRLYLIRYLFLIGINITCIAVNSLLITTISNKFNLS